MNLELLDPFEQDFPEVIEDTLEDGPAITVRFNRRGTLLAAGCSDGTIVIWDFDTRGVSRSLIGHVKPVTSLSWSRNGRYLLSSSRDWSCIVWDLLTGTKTHTIRFDTPVLNAQFHPKNNSIFIAALHQAKPVIVDFSNGVKRSPLLPSPEDDKGSNNTSSSNHDGSSDKTASTSVSTTTAASGPTQWILVVAFDRHGKRIYTGSNRGHISIIDSETRSLIYEIRPTPSAIKIIQFSRRGKYVSKLPWTTGFCVSRSETKHPANFQHTSREIVVNSNDRIIRLFTIKEDGPPEQVHKFQDLVNRLQWNQCCFSSDADYVIGGSAHQAQHNIYIWDKIGGNLVKILEGPKEPLEDLAWHPVRPIVASVSSYGTIHIWATNYQENWSAFAPDFKELEENVDYEEREDEFDIVPEEEASKRKHDDEDVTIDVTTIEKINPFNDTDSEDGEEETFYLPLLPSDHQQDEELLHYKHSHHHRSRRQQQQRNHRHPPRNSTSNHSHHNGRHQSHPQHDISTKEEAMDIIEDERKQDLGGHDRDQEQERTRSRDRIRDRDRDRGRDRNRHVEPDHDRGRQERNGQQSSGREKQHQQMHRDIDKQHRARHDDFDSDRKYSQSLDREYQNGSMNGHGYDRGSEQQDSRGSGRRKPDDDQLHSSSRSNKKQR
ncbi:hypothetical protein BGZ98_001655 [Dissophora globulifera]|nr:hypothetical protein BGZ98_001655 [Dissophora globulifera]